MVLPQPEPIAIVGSGCRFPGSSSSPSSLWDLLEKPRDVSKEPTNERFELRGYYHPNGAHHGTMNVQRAYMLDEDVGTFDATFFNISPNEAESIDPQQRLLMEVVYEALEAGGHRLDILRGSDTAVYVGTMSVDYNDIMLRDINSIPTYFSTGTSRAILANRISYFFDWHGPSMTIDTACSSSMVALHQSVQALRSGESRVAIAGGTELLLGPEQFVGESKMNLLSPTGQSRMWDASANGYARGDGIAAIVLKKLSDAIADGDHIECLIRQTGINQDGKSTGLTVPSSAAQADLIRSTYTKGGLDIDNPRDWPQFFEAHGTGTKAGDPREASAISQCFGSQPIHGNPLYVGSIKTIIGHTEGTAGLAGVFKASLAIQHGIIPPNMLLHQLNDEVAQYCDNLRVPNAPTAWPKLPDGVPRRASVNSFGFGGTNGHAILEEYQPPTETRNTATTGRDENNASVFRIFPFSAASEESLTANLRAYATSLKTRTTVDLVDLAWTLQSRRSALPFKTSLTAGCIEGLITKIDSTLEKAKANSGPKVGTRSAPTKPKVLGIFTGQGAQWATMAAGLIRTSETVRRKIEQLDGSLATLPEADRPTWRIADQLCADAEDSRLNEAALSQPLCTAIQVVLIDLLRSSGITFEAVVGHSSGEIAAAYAADYISAHDAIRIAYYRGVYAKHARGPKDQKGAMMAVGTTWEDAEELLNLPAFRGRVKIAAQNSAASLTLSGDVEALSHAKRVFDEEKKFTRLLVVDTAYHSHHMLLCSERYIQSLRTCGIQVNYNRNTSCTWYSSVKHGEPMHPEPSLGDLYWNDNMVNTVLFADAVKGAAKGSQLNLAIEVGPHPALKGPALQTLSDFEMSLPYTGVLKRKGNDLEAFSDALGFVWTHCGPGAVDFQTYEELIYPACKTPSLAIGLPAYQWDHKRVYWYQSRLAKKTQTRGEAFHELLGVPSPNNTDRDLRWSNFLKTNEIPWLNGHQLQGQTVFPAAGYVAMALEAGLKLAQGRSVKVLQIDDLTIDKAVTFDDGANFAVETLVALTGVTQGQSRTKKQTADFAVYSCANTGSSTELGVVSRGKVTVIYGTPSFSTLHSSPHNEKNMVDIQAEQFYSSLHELGYGYNGPFKTLSSTKRTLNQASARVETYGYGEDENTLIVHPTMLDVAFQASFLARMSPGDDQLWSLHVPTSIKCIRVNPELCASIPSSQTSLSLSAVLHESDSLSMLSSVDVFTEDGQETMIQVEGLSMKPFSPATADDDRSMFSTTVYGSMSPDLAMDVGNGRPPSEGLAFSQCNVALACVAQQIVHRYPHAKILEIGAGEGHATRAVLESIGSKLSYTFTDSSTEVIEKAAESFKDFKEKVLLKTFDPLGKPSSQGLDEHAYDLVIASNILASNSVSHTELENIRRLLKPGGYLLASGLTGDAPTRTLGGGTVEGNDARKHGPMNTAQWHGALRKAGFSGIDSITPQTSGMASPFSAIVTQAVDKRINFLRKPLSTPSSVRLDELVIVGNQSLKAAQLTEEIYDHLIQFCGKITVLDGLPTDDDDISSMATFINLADIHEPIFRDISAEQFEGLKCLFELASNILWVTEGARADEPYHNASIGFGRSIAYEMPHLSLQFLDLNDTGSTASRVISEAVLRLVALREWEETEHNFKDKTLWSREPELYVEKERLMVPRLLQVDDQNDRINSLRRVVTKMVDPDNSSVLISKAVDGSFVLREEVLRQSGQNFVQIKHSVLSAINVAPEAFLFLGAGFSQVTDEVVITLSDANASMSTPLAHVPAQWHTGGLSTLISAVAKQLLARRLISMVVAHSHLLVHGLDENESFVSILKQHAGLKDIDIKFSAANPAANFEWIQVTPWTSSHVTRQSIPATTTHFLDLSADDKNQDAAVIIREALPVICKHIGVSDLFRPESFVPAGSKDSILRALQDAVREAKTTASSEIPSASIRPTELIDATVLKSPLSVVDWTVDGEVPVQVQPIDATQLFSQHKTYVLVGLSGRLGQSISQWMSQNGAGCICLTSRTPKADPEWQAEMEKKGTTVKLIPMDVTNRADVERVFADLRANSPPIAGVASGAAVFHDATFSEMTHEILEKVMNPKVVGTKNLDEVLGDTKLDFFIVFSSLTSVVGNSGQSNYTAANAYMTGLVGQRRKRGLAATSLDIGSIVGIGYLERASDTAREQLIRNGFMAVSETDLHQLLAEAIRAGATNSSASPMVTTGCRNVQEGEEFPVPWIDDPRMQHKVILGEHSSKAEMAGKKSALPVRDQLAGSKSTADALEILKECFAAKLAMISRLADGQVGHDIPLVELGIDSLVAVEVRGWFLKELKTDIPVLKVLGGGTVATLCQQALEKLPESILPNVESGGPSKTGSSKPTAKPSVAKPRSPPSPSGSETGSPGRWSENNTTSPQSTLSSDQSPSSTPATVLSNVPSNVDLTTVAKSEKALTPSSDFVKTELVSFQQSRFWFLGLLIDDQATFNVTFYLRITGNLRTGDLERAVRLVTNRHESLRTCFVAHEQEADLAYQKVLPNSLVRLKRKNINRVEDVDIEYAAMKQVPFDLASGNLMRLVLLTLSASEHYLLFNYHHILMDGVSLQNFLADLEKAYQRQPLGPPPCQVPEFSRIQRAAFESGVFNEDIAYWKNEFPNGHPVLPLLPMSHITSRMALNSFNVHQVECRVDSELMAKVREAARVNGCTTFHFYLATFKAMLFRFTDAGDLTIGIADANRISPDVEGTIGLLLNLLTLRFQRNPSQTFAQSVGEARGKALEALKHSNVPFDILLKELNVPRSSAYSPFFQAFFDYRQGHQEKLSFGSTEFEFLQVHPGRTAYDMTLDVTDGADSARILFRTQASLYDKTAAQLLLNTFIHLLDTFATNTSLKLDDFALFSDKELKLALNVGHGPNFESSWPGGTIPHRIDQIAKENDDKVALKDGHGTILTYGAMINRTQAIAAALQQVGVGESSRVLVFEDATVDWPCSMLAIMRLGAVYVPLDLRNPLPRLADVAGSCKPVAILVDSTTLDNVAQVNFTFAEVVNVSEVGVNSIKVANVSRSDAVAALLYTSGSTGKPKGIVVTHSGLRNEIEGYTSQWGLKAERVLQQSAFTFNHSSDQIYTGLVNGGFVYIVPWDKRGDPIEVTKIIKEENITYTKATPAEYSLWLDYGSDNLKQASCWRFAFGGGESLTGTITRSLATLQLPNLRFFNSYGPTEISISSTKMEVAYRESPPDGRIPCGFMLPNYAAYILDDQRKPVPVGMPGELYIGGAGVSLGYLDNEELTEQHFLPNPYAIPEYVAQGWTRMYRTGDIAHLQDDGAMVFHNRIAGDTQVKIRGLRIELGDIESNIIKAAGGALKEVAVTLRDGDPPILVAHVVFAPHHHIVDTEAFLVQLLKNLDVPQYMVPVMAIPLERMPLSNHSKTDRKALKELPLPQRSNHDTGDNTESLTETMLELRRLWVDVLNTGELGLDIGPSTSFFTVGGNSLLIVRLQSRIRQTFNVTVRLFDLIDANTLSAMTQKIEESLNVDLIDWDKETALISDFTMSEATKHQPLKTTDKVILVTGSGGFLGKHILADLIARPDVSKIHCIGLRDKPGNTPRRLALNSTKIITHSGDLTEPWLGLGEEKFASLTLKVDVILHMAATRSFWDNYSLLRPINVTPTKLLVQMATGRKIPIHYVSSAGVVSAEGVEIPAGSAAKYQPRVDGSNGYVASRWASEQILEHAVSALDVPVSIHRFVPAKEPANQTVVVDALQHFVSFVDELSIMPDFSGTTGHFEMTPIHSAASQLAENLVKTPTQESSLLEFLHHDCPIRIDIAEMVAFLEEQRGSKGLERVPGLKFVGDMKRAGLAYFVTSQTLLMGGTNGTSAVLESRR